MLSSATRDYLSSSLPFQGDCWGNAAFCLKPHTINKIVWLYMREISFIPSPPFDWSQMIFFCGLLQTGCKVARGIACQNPSPPIVTPIYPFSSHLTAELVALAQHLFSFSFPETCRKLLRNGWHLMFINVFFSLCRRKYEGYISWWSGFLFNRTKWKPSHRSA